MGQGVDQVRLAALGLLHEVVHEHRPMAELTGPEGPLSDLTPAERARAQRARASFCNHCPSRDRSADRSNKCSRRSPWHPCRSTCP